MSNNKEQKEIEVVLKIFNPSNKDLRIDYPELADIEEFKAMDPSEVKFCWYVGNRTSPIFNLERLKKVSEAIKIIFPRGNRSDKWREIENGDIPEHIVRGIQKMTSFNAENRLKAMILADYTFKQLEKLTYMDDDTLMSLDMDEKKKYSDLVLKINKDLPDLVRNLESGFGVRAEDRSTGKKVLVGMRDLV